MNNIYKVIWSKAKNCYVVASEIARSHTKSASGSEKIGGVARHALLALAAASAIFCGGLVNVGASVQSETISPTGTTSNPVLTANNPDDDTQLNKVISAAREDKLVTKDNISDQLTDYAKASDLSAKADRTYVDQKLTEAGTNVDNKLADYYNRAEVDGKIVDEENARNTAITNAIGQERNDRTTAIDTAINGEVTNRNKAINTAIAQEVTDRNAAVTNAKAELQAKITAEETARTNTDIAFNTRLTTAEGKIGANETAIGELKAKDTELEGKITKNSGAITDLQAKDTELEGRIHTNEGDIETNKNAITAIDKRTAGIARNDATSETTIEKNVTVDNRGNVKAKGDITADGKLTGKGVDAGAGDITTTGAVNAGSLNVENASQLKGDVTMDKTLSVTGDTKLKKTDVDGTLNVTGESDLKGNVILGTNAANTVTVNGNADFNAGVKMNNGLTVTGDTNLENTTVDGNLKVTGTITTDKMVFGDKATNNYTEIDKGHITSKNDVLAGDATKKKSSMELDHSKLEVGVTDKDSNGHLTMTADQTSIKNSDLDGKNYSEIVADKDSVTTTVKDEKDNTTSTKSSATEIRNYAKDKDGNKTNNVQTATQNKSWAKDKDGNESSIVQTGKDITNTAQNGTITNDANHIENNANTMNTTVSGQATESYGGLNTTVNGAENHTVTGKQTNTVGGGQENNISGGQKNNILTGDQETTVSNGNISNTAKNVTNEGTESVTNKVGANEVKVSKDGVDIKAEAGKKITESVGTASRVVENDKITDKAADSTVTTENGKGTTFGKAASTDTTNIYGDSIKTGTINAKDTTTDKLTAGAAAGADGGRLTVDANDGVKGSYKSGDYTSRSYILANTLKSGVDNGKDPTDADFVGSRTDHYMDGDKAKLDETVKDADGSNVTKKTSTGASTEITNGTTTTTTKQDAKDITNTAKNGTITNDAKVITNKASEVINNEAININNTATGIITSKASEIKNEANKLISNKVGENTWENMEDGKIVTSIKDGTKQNLTQSDAEKTEHSVVNGSNSTVNKQTSEEITDAVTNGTTTNVTQNTATSSNNTIADKNGNANTVISTTDGTSFINSKAAAPVTGASGAGTAVNTTIKGNTITTGKVTMDYAEVMKDLGVRGNANIAGKTTTGSLEVTGTSTLKGDVMMESNATVKNNLTVEGTTKTKTLNVTENATVGGTLDVTGKATFSDDVDIKKNLSVVGDVTANSYKVGDKTYIDKNGIHANGQKITDVADGSISEGSKDAVNGGQLYGVKNDLEGKVNKVGANAAAMANLHPMEFDPDSKWNIAAAIGNYGSETAAALGAFYRPNDDVMVNLSTAFGTGENMVGGGVSVRLGKSGNKLSREENNALKAQVDDLTARMDALLSVLNPNMSKDFPDVPENHWAYEAVSRLAGNDIVQGYPDGEFHGERTMTRYEMAEIIYNALSRGAEAEKELVEEFKPELQAMAASEKATAEKAEG